MAVYQYKIGTSTASLVNVEELSTPVTAPYSVYRPYSVYSDLGDGSVRGGGWAEAEWQWGRNNDDFIRIDQRNALRAYCTGASSVVYINTRTNEAGTGGNDDYKVFKAVMIWPQEEQRESHVRRGFTLKFRKLEGV